jgi:excisionase family DNA binding protein
MTNKAAEAAELIARLTQLLITATSPIVPDIPIQRDVSERVLLTVEEAAQRLNIGKTKTYALVMSGEIESVLIGRLRRVHVDAVTAYAAQLFTQQNTRPNAA